MKNRDEDFDDLIYPSGGIYYGPSAETFVLSFITLIVAIGGYLYNGVGGAVLACTYEAGVIITLLAIVAVITVVVLSPVILLRHLVSRWRATRLTPGA